MFTVSFSFPRIVSHPHPPPLPRPHSGALFLRYCGRSDGNRNVGFGLFFFDGQAGARGRSLGQSVRDAILSL